MHSRHPASSTQSVVPPPCPPINNFSTLNSFNLYFSPTINAFLVTVNLYSAAIWLFGRGRRDGTPQDIEILSSRTPPPHHPPYVQ